VAYLVLARKYRPQTFADLFGQEHIARTLTNAIKLDRVAHAFLFTGVRGVGKTTVARILAKVLNCETLVKRRAEKKDLTDEELVTPCSTCVACAEIAQGISADVLEIDGASNRGIDSIRELRESVRYMPRQGAYRIFIIDEVHMLTQESFNALLKTLEEPPAHVKFIFATTEAHKIPVTILSRCQRYDFHRIATTEVIRRIDYILGQEHIQIAKAGVAKIARAAEGSMRDALSLLDQVISFGGEEVTAEVVSEALGSADRSLLFGAAKAVFSRDPKSALSLIDHAFRRGHDMGQLSEDLLTLFRDFVAAKAGASIDELTEEDRSEVRALIKNLSLPEMIRAFQMMTKVCEEIARSNNPKVLLEVVLVKLATLPPMLPWDELLSRLEKLEGRVEPGGGSSGSLPSAQRGGGKSGSDGPMRASAEESEPPRFELPPELPPRPFEPRRETPVRAAFESASVVRAEPSPRLTAATPTRATYRSRSENDAPEYLREEIPVDDASLGKAPLATEERTARRTPERTPSRELAAESPIKEPIPPKEAAGPAIEPVAWERAVRAFKDKRPLIGSLIERGALVKTTSNHITLAFAPGSLESDSVKDPDKKRSLEVFMSDSFGRPITIDIIERAGAEQETIFAKGEIKAADDRRKRERATAEHSSVKNVLRIFNIDETSVTTKLKDS
jgi:DNA polymerase III subunit gamma/tau